MNFRRLIACILAGAVTSMAGYPIYNNITHVFNGKNLLIVIFCCIIIGLVTKDEDADDNKA